MGTLIVAFLTILVFFQEINGTELERPKNGRIIGGANARAGQFNFAVALNVTTSISTHFCMGSLMDFHNILTSGHCVFNAVLINVKIGSIYLTGGDDNRATLSTTTYFIHPDFDPDTSENDIGVVRLRDFMLFTEYIGPVYLSVFALEPDTPVTLIGWGQTNDMDGELSDTLQSVEVVTLSNEECQQIYGSQIKDSMVCAVGNLNQGTCIGDMGGPLLITWSGAYWLAGVASFVSGNGCESTNPSGFTRLEPCREWIETIV